MQKSQTESAEMAARTAVIGERFRAKMIWHMYIQILLLNGIMKRMPVYHRMKLHISQERRSGGSVLRAIPGKPRSIIDQKVADARYALPAETVIP